MDYNYNFDLVWRHFDKLSYGMLLSLELALLCCGCIVIGLVLALLHVWRKAADARCRLCRLRNVR